MFFWIVFDFFSNVNSCVYLDLFTLQIQLEKVGLVKHPKKRFSLYFARSLWGHKWRKVDKICELLKDLFLFFLMQPAKNTFSQRCKKYKPSKLNGQDPKIFNNHHSCNLAFLNQNSYLHLVFWLKSSSYNIIWPKKLIFWIFIIFYHQLHRDLNFAHFAPLGDPRWGTPTPPPTPLPTYVFLLTNEPTYDIGSPYYGLS